VIARNAQLSFTTIKRYCPFSVLCCMMMWLIVLPSFAKTPDTIVMFEECESIDKKNVSHLLDVELPDHVPDYVKKITVLCTRNFRVEVLLVTNLGNSVRRTLHLDGYDDDERDRVLALSIAEVVGEAKEWGRRKEAPLQSKNTKKDRRLTLIEAQSDNTRRNDQGTALRGVAATVAWQHMKDVDAWGPDVAFVRTYPIGLGWRLDSSVLFAKNDTAAGDVNTLIASGSLVPFMSWRRSRLFWCLGIGARVGLARIKGVPAQDAPRGGKAIAGVWYGPLVMADLGLKFRHIMVTLSIESGYSLTAVVGHALEKDIAVDGYWVRSVFFVAFVF
jgi:hypothetical protein